MKKNKKGFTLIELLAVIVILAIIALIAVPLILNIIERARKGAFTRSAENVLKASNLYYTNSLLEVNQPEEISFTCDGEKCLSSKLDEQGNQINLNVDGSMGKGTVNISSKGEVDFELSNGAYCAIKQIENKKITVNKGLCGEVTINTPSNLNISSITAGAGEIKVVGSVTNLDAELKGFQFSIDNGETWNPNVPSINKVYTFTGLEIGKSYTVMMKVINLNDEEKIITKEITTSSVKVPTYKIEPVGWSREKVVTINYEEIDTNVYKNVYSIDNGNTFVEYIEPINIIENINIIIDVQKKEDNTSILTTRPVINITKIDRIEPTLTLGEIEVTDKRITIPFTAVDNESGIKSTKCEYGIDENYGSIGTIENNTCVIDNLNSETTYYYKVATNDNAENNTEKIGSVKTLTKPTYIDIVYYNPESGSKCTKSEYETNLQNYLNKGNVSPTGLKTGCMKWYAYAETDTTYDMILDHNTTENINFTTTGSGATPEIIETLESDTSLWLDSINSRLISANEIAFITGNKTFDSNTATYSDYFYFDSNSQTQTVGGLGTSKYSWLYDHTWNCTSYGCNIADSNKYDKYDVLGYWTGDTLYSNSSSAWAVYFSGNLHFPTIGQNGVGIRPVITVPKSNL